MKDLREFMANAQNLVKGGYYETSFRIPKSPSLLQRLHSFRGKVPLIAEIKFSSPTASSGLTKRDFPRVLDSFVNARPLALSILTEPHVFNGDISFLAESSERGLPTLMKDFIMNEQQIRCAASCGASAVLLIQKAFTKGYASSRDALIDTVHSLGMETVLEVNDEEEWDEAITSNSDIIGINNRDLETMEVDLHRTYRILSSRSKDRPVIAMSGIRSRQQVQEMLMAGADAVLVGSALMSSTDPGEELRKILYA